MEEINPFTIREDTKPSYETNVAKWYLLKKMKEFALWRWDSKKDARDRRFLITSIETSNVVNEGYRLADMLDKLDFFEAAFKEDK